MKRFYLALCGTWLFTACQSQNSLDAIVSQKYVHKYGFDLSEQEWEEREQEGQVISMMKNGVKVARNFENGQLQGPTTYTFPHSTTVEKLLLYDQGTLLKETLFDAAGMPIREEAYEFDDRTIITLWDEKGVPLSIEEYDGDLLAEGKYYTPTHEEEGRVEGGFGERVKRDRTGSLLSRDQIENGWIASRIAYHSTGEIHAVSHYCDYQLHGEQTKFTATGKPLMKLNWNQGILDGEKVVYRNGVKIAEIPYVRGQKQGTERHYDDLGNLTAEIEWKNDKKHGCSKFYTDETTEMEWFHKGQSVTAQKFEMLENRERLIAEMSQE